MSDIHALSGAYAIDALDDIERAHFERHLAQCPTCRSEVESLQEAAALLAETTIATPSAQLRERVLADIANVRPLPPVVAPVEPPAEVDEDAGAGRSTRPGTVTELAPRRRRRLPTFLAAAAAVVAIGTGGVVWNQLNDGPQDTVSQIQAAGDVQRFSVEVGDGGTATVYRSAKLNEAAIVTHGMPSAPTGRQYVLWLKHGATMVPAGVMPAGADNEVVLSGDAATADGAAVSIEDAGSEPTSPSNDIAAAFSFDA